MNSLLNSLWIYPNEIIINKKFNQINRNLVISILVCLAYQKVQPSESYYEVS